MIQIEYIRDTKKCNVHTYSYKLDTIWIIRLSRPVVATYVACSFMQFDLWSMSTGSVSLSLCGERREIVEWDEVLQQAYSCNLITTSNHICIQICHESVKALAVLIRRSTQHGTIRALAVLVRCTNRHMTGGALAVLVQRTALPAVVLRSDVVIYAFELVVVLQTVG